MSEVAEAIEEALATYRKVEETELPTTLKDAVAQGWQLTIDAVQMGVVMHYADDERKSDGNRVMSLKKAIEIMRKTEERMIKETVVDQPTVILKALLATEQAIIQTINIVIEFVKTILSQKRFSILQLLKAILLNLLEISTVANLVASIRSAVKVRDAGCTSARKAAFPQASVGRVRRRKLAR